VQTLNELLHRLVPEHSVFRIDHYLAQQTALNILGLWFANRSAGPVGPA
jgi:glucose-6-phosphate 1-dehydrogenase